MMLPTAASLALLALRVQASPLEKRVEASCTASSEWPGWDGIKYAFIFGDSYTQTGFNYTLDAPSQTNPLGNPTYPGWTSSNGPNWVDFLTVEYNASLLQTYNLAYGGATVDSALVAPYIDTVLSLKDQVLTEFVPAYTGNSPLAPNAPNWTAADSIFGFWIGINDVGNSYWLDTATLNAQIFDVYSGLVDAIYAAGGRNFFFVNVPPTDRSPLMLGQTEWAITTIKADIEAFNGLLSEMTRNLTDKHEGEVNVWVYDANTAFGEVLDDPAVYEQTAGYKNTTAYCEDYENGTPAWDTLIENCGIPVDEYFWLNSLHPTYHMHEVVAEKVAESLASGPTVC
ncbi:uncharacterized protein BCR38DRAFT_373253 [Pseudomassariella vexata]|uniref:Carbohydrate esterase family 16 protein n=1 Tax=Pseudomassariella vexata TaxID=1141098 RepID=A0A1Y2DQ66_9PEZI|nr:uncharacterized protein BCR38DRAFT_373253 [Pseudomassariella vexata]ORY61428.1 hypothetical protein BCR38DRAFT_373253 [Pseudomassariella vexata]